MYKNYQEGQILLINKPLHWTSFDVVKKLRIVLKVKKIGHAGTLDPLATGLLVIGTGKFTKKLSELQGLDKTYTGIFEIGKTTPSHDLETTFDSKKNYGHLTPEDVEKARLKFIGDIQQTPPAYSAVKSKGERAYKKARQNKVVKLEPRCVTIFSFEIDAKQLPEISFTIKCSKGTYIRAIARDFGCQLGVGAYLKKLERTHIGNHSITNARKLETFPGFSQSKKVGKGSDMPFHFRKNKDIPPSYN